MELKFDIAKKMTKPAKGTRGITLRSIKGDREGVTAVLLSETYGEIKKQVEAFRMMTGNDLSFRARGTSLEISSVGDNAIITVFGFLKAISFNTEDAMDVCEYFGKSLGNPGETGLTPVSVNLTPDELLLTVTTDIEGTQDIEPLYEAVSKGLEKYNMGIVKETPGTVAEDEAENS